MADLMKELRLLASSTDVEVWEGDQAEAELQVRGTGWSKEQAEENARGLRLSVERGETTTVRLVYAHPVRISSSRLKVTVPKGTALVIETSSGDVQIGDRSGATRIRTSSGDVELGHMQGDVTAATSSGDVRIDRVEGNLTVTTTSGDAQVGEVSGSVRARTTSGDQIFRGIGHGLTAQATSGEITAVMVGLTAPVDVQTTSGNVRLELPTDAHASIEVSSHSGDVSGPSLLQFDKRHRSATGRLGSGEHRVSVETTSGDVEIEVR